MITFHQTSKSIRVLLENKHVGDIIKAEGGYQYMPKGRKKFAGDTYPTLTAVKQSLIED